MLFGRWITPEDLRTLARGAAEIGAITVVDESYANCRGGGGSVAGLTAELPNLIVLRDLSKFYGMGGLRFGYAVCGHTAAALLREVAPPLAVAALSIKIAEQLLRAGNLFGELRERIARNKPSIIDLLTGSGVAPVEPCGDMPWVLIPIDGGAQLLRAGIATKPLAPSTVVVPDHYDWVRLSIPVSDERMAAVIDAICTATVLQ